MLNHDLLETSEEGSTVIKERRVIFVREVIRNNKVNNYSSVPQLAVLYPSGMLGASHLSRPKIQL